MTNLTRWTLPANYFGATWEEYYRSGFGQHRDSDALERTNFTTALEALGGESETVLVVRESHWAVGWVEWIAIHESDTAALATANDLLARISDYPCLDDDAWSETEYDEAAAFWESLSPRGKVEEAMDARERFHWLAKTPVWRFGRYSFHDLTERGGEIGEYLAETLLHA